MKASMRVGDMTTKFKSTDEQWDFFNDEMGYFLMPEDAINSKGLAAYMLDEDEVSSINFIVASSLDDRPLTLQPGAKIPLIHGSVNTKRAKKYKNLRVTDLRNFAETHVLEAYIPEENQCSRFDRVWHEPDKTADDRRDWQENRFLVTRREHFASAEPGHESLVHFDCAAHLSVGNVHRNELLINGYEIEKRTGGLLARQLIAGGAI